jgi:hypothetical protein
MSDREALRAEAEARHELHRNHSTPQCRDHDLIGLVGEAEFGRVFGLPVDMTRRPAGDEGVDFLLPLMVEGKEEIFPVDVKASRLAYNLIVEVGRPKPRTIYVQASYDPATEGATLLGWEWGSRVLKAPTKPFAAIVCHYIHRSRIRPISELLQRRPGGHYCACGRWGSFGFERQWFCLDHAPSAAFPTLEALKERRRLIPAEAGREPALYRSGLRPDLDFDTLRATLGAPHERNHA